MQHFEPLFLFAAHLPPRELALLTLDQIERAATWWGNQQGGQDGRQRP